MAKKILYFAIFLTVFLFSASPSSAQIGIAQLNDWVIRDFKSEIQVNKDSSLLITEKITADCDSLPNKHGIFRILPTEIQAEGKIIKIPVQLISITDFSGQKLKYSTSNDPIYHTVTWKIGDPNKTVTGLNYYKITYKVKNAIRFGNPNFDEIYWNLNGNFWEIMTYNFVANINFPTEVTKENSRVDYYTGLSGSKLKNLASYRWIDNNTLQFYSTQRLNIREGITASVTFPKNIFIPYKPSFIEKYGNNLWFSLPVFVFIICFIIWWKYGKDPKINKTIIPEFGIPENLTPIEMGMLITDGKFKNNFISAALINLAAKGYISIKEKEKKLFFAKDFKLEKLKEADDNLNTTEKLIMEGVFQSQGEISLSSLRNRFYKDIKKIKKSATDDLINKDMVTKQGLFFAKILFLASIAAFFLTQVFPIFIGLSTIPYQSTLVFLVSAFILNIFAYIMPKRTEKGTELLWKVNGFKLYMETAEKYREQFYEKENIFEKLLPYAMVFGITKLWIKKMEQIYGEKYFETYHPVWFIGTNLGSFDANSFTSAMNSISSSISSSMHGASGAGGGGFSGGGGGGGGGGGW